MKEYVKPIVIATDGLAEGVYMASGSSVPAEQPAAGGGASYSLKETGAWDGNKIYDITLTNNSDARVDSITVTVGVVGTVNTIGGGVEGTVNGNTATITCNNWGNGFDAGASGTYYMAVTGSGDFSLQ